MRYLLFWAQDMTILQAVLVSLVITGIAAFLAVCITWRKNIGYNFKTTIATAIVVGLLTFGAVVLVDVQTANKQAPTWVFSDYTISQLIETNEHAPDQSSLPAVESMLDDTSLVHDTVFYLYKWGDKNCADVYPQTIQTIEQLPVTMRYIATTSTVGQDIAYRYRVFDIPALVCIQYGRSKTIDLTIVSDPVATVNEFFDERSDRND